MEYISKLADKYRSLILGAEEYIRRHPETGYKEYLTSEYMAKNFEQLGYTLTYAEGITGFYTLFDTGKEGPEVLVLGELDSVICPSHPDADPVSGAVHSCGHNAQCAALLGIAALLKEPQISEGLCGRIRLCAVPAEEMLEIEYRMKLRREGKIKYLGGKTEFLSRGYFDGVDIALMVHTCSTEFHSKLGSVGFITKKITYKGRAAHAGGAPHSGINALYAANCGLNAINALRETFREADLVRVHPIITHGGDMVNAIPERVEMESYLRSADFGAMKRENTKVNRALIGAALSLGANVDITDLPGYAPLYNDPGMLEIAKDAAKLALPDEPFSIKQDFSTGSTDMGDISCIIPSVQPYAPGAVGTGHGNDYRIADPDRACVKSAVWQVAMLTLLLSDGASRAKKVMAEFKPHFPSKEAFLDYLDSIFSSGDRICWEEDEKATVNFK